METKTKVMCIVLALAMLSAVVGCSHRLKVTDPTSGKVFYTKKVHKHSGGSITFKDAHTGAKVTLQSSEKQEVSKKEFKDYKKGIQPAQPAAPVQPAQPAPSNP